MSLSPETGRRLLAAIKKRVLASHFNLAQVDYQDWFQQIAAEESTLLSAGAEEFEAGVRRLLVGLKSSHTAFYHERPTRFPPQHTISATVTSIDHQASKRWMFLDVFPEGPADKARIAPGDLLLQIDGIEQRPPELPLFGIGRTHRLTVLRRAETETEVAIAVPYAKGTKQRPPIVEPRAVVPRMLEPGVGMLKVTYFSGALGMRFASELDSAIADLKSKGCKRLVVDLRGNIGGSLGFARLASYLCPDVRPIGHSLTPQRLKTGYEMDQLPKVMMPRNRIELATTLARFAIRDKSLVLLTQGLGPQPFHQRISILVNQWTNSAGEIVAAFAKETGVAVIVGESTRGNVLGAANFAVGAGYWVRLPVFGWFSSRGTTLEGTGVTPDTPVPIPAQMTSGGTAEDLHLISAVYATTAP